MFDRSAAGQLSSLSNESCPTADHFSIGRPNGPAYSTDELLNTPQNLLACMRNHWMISCDLDLWPRYLQSWSFRAPPLPASWTTCASLQQVGLFVLEISCSQDWYVTDGRTDRGTNGARYKILRLRAVSIGRGVKIRLYLIFPQTKFVFFVHRMFQFLLNNAFITVYFRSAVLSIVTYLKFY